MAKPRFEHCPMCAIRAAVEERLEVPAYKPPYGNQPEAPMEFWSRIGEAGLLSEAVALYDKLAVERKTRAHTRRETKREFQQRVKEEGRQEKAERLQAEFLAQGLSQREAQEKLVLMLQPLAGGQTRPWQTPNPWNEGRFCLKKADQDALLALKKDQPSKDDLAKRRLRWAEHRLEERRALVAARRRVQAMKAAPRKKIRARPKAGPKTAAPQSPPEVREFCNCFRRRGVHHRLCTHYVEGKTPIPCQECDHGVVSPTNPTYDSPRRNLCDSCNEKRRSLGWPL